MYPNGYVMLDMKGTDMTDATQQAVDASLDTAVPAAIASGKPIVLTNLFYSSYAVSPVNAYAINGVIYAAGCSFTFATGGKVTVADLYTPAE